MASIPCGLMLCDDLIFTSKVTGTARTLGLMVQTARTPDLLVTQASQSQPVCVIVDLHYPHLDLPALIGRLAEVCATMPRVIGYGSHVDTATLSAARQAGCDPVWPRSKFVDDLPSALPRWLGCDSGPTAS